MILSLQKSEDSSSLTFNRWGLGIVGPAIDDRGTAALDFVAQNSVEQLESIYDPDTFTITLGGGKFLAEESDGIAQKINGQTVVLEATTLGFSEIYILLRSLKEAGAVKVTLLYLEPSAYARPRKPNVVHPRDFEISKTVPGYKGIPGATLVTTTRTNQRAIFFLGYEERRLDAALEAQQASPQNTMVAFGVPAYSAGWEMNAFANNARVLQDNNIRGDVHFCGADDPWGAFQILQQVFDSLDRVNGERLIIGPIGTKPHGIGAALFAAVNRDHVGILYDHPKRSDNRTKSIRAWHLFEVQF